MRAAALGLALLLLAGCQGRVLAPWATPRAVEGTFESPSPILRSLADRRALLADLRARARFTLTTPEQELSGDHALVARGFGAIRLETLSPMGQPTGLLVAKGGDLRWVDPVGGRYWDGPASGETMRKLVGVPLEPKEMVAILAGALPPGDEQSDARLEAGSTDEPYRLLLSGGPESGWREEAVVVERGDLTIRSRTRYDGEGREVFKVLYGRFRDIEGYPFPLTVEVALPERQISLKVEYQKVLINQQLGEELFELPIPPGAERAVLD